MTKAQEKSLHGTYTKMLRMVLGVSWKDKVNNNKVNNDVIHLDLVLLQILLHIIRRNHFVILIYRRLLS